MNETHGCFCVRWQWYSHGIADGVLETGLATQRISCSLDVSSCTDPSRHHITPGKNYITSCGCRAVFISPFFNSSRSKYKQSSEFTKVYYLFSSSMADTEII